jgi:hypothetical protein
MNDQPTHGGSYRRLKDGTLVRADVDAVPQQPAAPAAEPEAAAPAPAKPTNKRK